MLLRVSAATESQLFALKRQPEETLETILARVIDAASKAKAAAADKSADVR